jgi:hypothetical protein
VLDGIGKELQLDEAAMEPSRMVLHDYGNVSSSTTWYTLGYVESVRGAKKGGCAAAAGCLIRKRQLTAAKVYYAAVAICAGSKPGASQLASRMLGQQQVQRACCHFRVG